MKKFTVISLLLVLVAGSVFAATMVPYCNADYGIRTYSTSRKLNFQGLNLDGTITYGAKDATGAVDVKGSVNVNYADQLALNADGTTSPKADVRVFDVVPSASVDYKAEKLRAGVSATLTSKFTGANEFALKKNSDTLEVKISAKYAEALKNSTNVLKVTADETATFSANKQVASKTAASLVYYVPSDAKLDVFAKKPVYTFAATATADVTVYTDNAKLLSGETKKNASLTLDYNRTLANSAKLNLNGKATFADAKNATSGNREKTVTTDFKGTYTYEGAKGAIALDQFKFTATAELYNKVQPTKVSKFEATATVDAPHLIPVESYDKMALNLPFEVGATFDYFLTKDADYDKDLKLACDITVHPFYAEFDGSKEIFGQSIDAIDTTFAYGNYAYFNKALKEMGPHGYSLAAGFELDLANATFCIDAEKAGITEVDDTTSKPVAVRMSYVKAY